MCFCISFISIICFNVPTAISLFSPLCVTLATANDPLLLTATTLSSHVSLSGVSAQDDSAAAAASSVKEEPAESGAEPMEQEAELITSDKEKKERKWKMRDRAGNISARYIVSVLLLYLYSISIFIVRQSAYSMIQGCDPVHVGLLGQ